MSVTQLDSSASAQIRTKRARTLAGSLPHPDEEWTWADAEALGMTWSDFRWLVGNTLLAEVGTSGRSTVYRTPSRLAEAVQHYADGAALVRLPEESE